MKKYYYVVVMGETYTTFCGTESEYSDHVENTRSYNGSQWCHFTDLYDTKEEAIDAGDLHNFKFTV